MSVRTVKSPVIPSREKERQATSASDVLVVITRRASGWYIILTILLFLLNIMVMLADMQSVMSVASPICVKLQSLGYFMRF